MERSQLSGYSQFLGGMEYVGEAGVINFMTSKAPLDMKEVLWFLKEDQVFPRGCRAEWTSW